MEFDLTKVAKKTFQNVVNNTLYRGKPIIDWINFIADNADDLISRQAAIDFIKEHSYPVRYDRNSIEQGMTITGIEQALNEVPNIQSKQGEWIMHIDDLFPCESTQECSVCHAEQLINGNDDNFCPNCGAKMKSEGKK